MPMMHSPIINRTADLICADCEWVESLHLTFKYGMRSAPRGMLVYEMVAATNIVSMQNPIIYHPMRAVGYKFMAAEAAWMLEGRRDVETIKPYSKDIANFSDDGYEFFGAYGPKIRSQFSNVVRKLLDDVDSRQAVINIWRENPPKTKDVPCTLSLQWIIRDAKLHCMATMRSSDLWLGHPYDTFSFSAISYAVAIALAEAGLDVELGNLFMTAGSKHIYERNIEAVGAILEHRNKHGLRSPDRKPIFTQGKYSTINDFIQDLWDAANSDKGALIL